jgi:hypothetical protein
MAATTKLEKWLVAEVNSGASHIKKALGFLGEGALTADDVAHVAHAWRAFWETLGPITAEEREYAVPPQEEGHENRRQADWEWALHRMSNGATGRFRKALLQAEEEVSHA